MFVSELKSLCLALKNAPHSLYMFLHRTRMQ